MNAKRITYRYTRFVLLRPVLFLAIFPALLGQVAGPRPKVEDYPAHATLSKVELGAEYLLHSIPTERGFIPANDFLVVEVAVFPRSGPVSISSGQFTLRVNGKKLLTPDSAGMIVASIKYPDWEQRPSATVSGGVGDRSVILGPPSVGRFPGDPRGGVPRIPTGTDPDDSSGIEQTKDKPYAQRIEEAGLPNVRTDRAIKGCLYFRFDGKTKSIHKLELLFDSGESGMQGALTLI